MKRFFKALLAGAKAPGAGPSEERFDPSSERKEHTIFRIDDSAKAGCESWYFFTLSREGEHPFVLSFTQLIGGAERRGRFPMLVHHFGVRVYEELSRMVRDAGYSIEDADLEGIAAEIAVLDADMAEEFRTAPEEIPRREAEARETAIREAAILAPFNERIESYVTRISDDKLYYPGAGYVYPSRRYWTRRFLQQYVLEHGELPTDRQYIKVDINYLGEHDFSDLAAD